ncbi:GTP cyclohydrolase II [Aliiroseovarius sediminilitoris]|uniref:GTP cyclohydrolase-2 n=1 Tax=Aliiroseovarius sediminilitoris TaxID=1173584 RepID=A0A1I0MNJ4_9RHOB|nr:GTP cyclohydrolase II [Aliiroseovarius sediminilitoris]SEV90096.1 GTP cyclohydrolase II [Aliiroseovarius sediminilitoris]
MTLAPNQTELLARARADLRMGVPVVLARDGRTVLVAAAETLSSGRLSEMRTLGAPVLAITPRRAATLKARAYSDRVARIELPHDAGTDWIASVADPADDLTHPMKGPFRTLRGGDDGLEAQSVALCKSARLLPAALVIDVSNTPEVATNDNLTAMSLDDAMVEIMSLAPVIHARLPLSVSEAGRLHIYRPDDGSEEHYAVEIGRPPRDNPVLARLHSACFTGDVLGSLKCDCGPQLHTALARIGQEGQGVLLYLNQEGRGIGLANKMRAYSLQDQGFDTVEANHRLGFEDDERDFRIGSMILKSLGFSSVRLMTNNPRKVAMMNETGIEVTERVPLKVGKGTHNEAYLATKASKSGHLL